MITMINIALILIFVLSAITTIYIHWILKQYDNLCRYCEFLKKDCEYWRKAALQNAPTMDEVAELNAAAAQNIIDEYKQLYIEHEEDC